MRRLAASFFLLAFLSGCSMFEGSSTATSVQEKSPTALEHEVSNCSAEIAVLQRRLAYLEGTQGEMQQSISKNAGSENLSARVAKLESSQTALQGDVKAMKARTSEISSSLKAMADSSSKLEKTSSTHQESLKGLDTAVRALTEAMQKGITSKEVASGKTYKVKPGDTLGKIALDNNTTVQALLSLNEIKSGNHIVAGQELQIPE